MESLMLWIILAAAVVLAVLVVVLLMRGRKPEEHQSLSAPGVYQVSDPAPRPSQETSRPRATPASTRVSAPGIPASPRVASRDETPLEKLERRFAVLLRPQGGQFPVPWFTDLENATRARVLLVGQNPEYGIPEEGLTPARFQDALFRRKGESLRSLCTEDPEAGPTLFRTNAETLCRDLAFARVVETSVVSFAPPRVGELQLPSRDDAAGQEAEIFLNLLDAIRPQVLLLHGGSTLRLARKHLQGMPSMPMPVRPEGIHALPADVSVGNGSFRTHLIVIPSLVPPQFPTWSAWWPEARKRVVDVVAGILGEEPPAEPADPPESSEPAASGCPEAMAEVL